MEQGVALTGRNRIVSGGGVSAGWPATRPARRRPTAHARYRRRQTTPTDNSVHNNTGPSGGPIIKYWANHQRQYHHHRVPGELTSAGSHSILYFNPPPVPDEISGTGFYRPGDASCRPTNSAKVTKELNKMFRKNYGKKQQILSR